MHMHGFTILLGYGLGPFVCSEQIVYTCFFLIIMRHSYTSACILCYLPAHSRIHYDRSLENLVHRLIVLPRPHRIISRGNISLNNWNNMCRVHDTLCKTKL